MARVSIAEGKGLKIDGVVVPLLSGTLHYWRHDPRDWPALLRALKGLGFPFVETYIPWGVHEIAPKSFDFGGVDPRRNLEGFIACVKKSGLKLIVRPGPHINAELEDFGYPRRIVTDPDLVAREAHGGAALMDVMTRPFGIPSYASEKFYREAAGWFDAVAPVLRKNLHPDGPVAAVQVDNETGYFFRTGAYTLDYHPDSIAWYRLFLSERYGSVPALNEVYGSAHASFDEVEPPRCFSGNDERDLPRHLDWQRYKEWQILRCLRRLRDMWTDRGVSGVPFFQNYFGSADTPYDVAGTEAGAPEKGLEIAGLDDYSRRDSWKDIAHKCLYLSGTSRLPFIPEFGAGSWAFPPCEWAMDEGDTRFTAPLLFMFGLKAVNHYMAVERDRWMGSPLSSKGEPRKGLAQVHRELNAFVRESGILDLELQADVLLLADRDAERMGRSLSLADPHPFLRIPREASWADPSLPFSPAPHEDHPGRFRKLLEFALRNRLAFRSSDTNLPTSSWGRYKALLIPSYGVMDAATQRALHAFVKAGGTAILGPGLPGMDMSMRPLAVFPVYEVAKPMPVGAGKFLLLEEWDDAAALGALREAGILPFLPGLPPEILATRFAGASGGVRREVVFLANPSDVEMQLPKAAERTVDWKPLYGAVKPWKAGKGFMLPAWSVVAFDVPPDANIPPDPGALPPSHQDTKKDSGL